jgi:Zn-dependent protease with chaperone function
MIAHEVGHDRNGDVSRGVFIGSAVNGLDSLSDILRPPRSRPELNLGMYEWMTGGLMWVITRPIDWLLWLQARLLLRDMQRAEYLADAEAAGVAGTAATIAMHERLLLYPTFQHAVQQASLADDATGTVDRVRQALRSVPERERERRRRVARLERTRLEDTHPPTGMRIALLEERAQRDPAVTLLALDSARIDAELAALEPSVGRDLVDRYRTSLHYG